MENQSLGLKQIVAQQSYIAQKSVCFGLFSHLVYQPTNSRLRFVSHPYGAVVREEMKDLFRLDDAAFARRLSKCSSYEQAVNGNLMLEGCVSADKQFAALRLLQWSQIDYQPVSEVHQLQGADAAQAAKVFSL